MRFLAELERRNLFRVGVADGAIGGLLVAAGLGCLAVLRWVRGGGS